MNGIIFSFYCLFTVQVQEQATVSEVMKFCTGLDRVPPLGLKLPITLEYHSGILPMAAACFNVLRLPTGNGSYEEFSLKMDVGILGSTGYYGLV